MKSMKGLSMNKMIGSIKKKASGVGSSSNSAEGAPGTIAAASPETTVHSSVKAFCESGGNVKGDEVLFLPPIVDAAESSPAAAAECARLIRKYLSKDNIIRPSWQYNAVMLLKILTDNPGETFTRNFDQKFVDTVKTLLKQSRDTSVRHIVMETLDDFEHTRQDDGNLALIVSMWKKEKEKAYKDYGGRMPPPPPQGHIMTSPPVNAHSQNYFTRSHSNKRLPDPVELASRLEEARTSAKLLEQVVMNTPPSEILDNDLIKEFADRCLSASRSIQGYMVSENPAPDNDTMESLIDTNEQLQTALNQHQRSVLNARKQLGLNERGYSESPAPSGPDVAMNGALQSPEWQQTPSANSSNHDSGLLVGNGKGKANESSGLLPNQPTQAGPSGSGSSGLLPERPQEDPFADPNPEPRSSYQATGPAEDQRLAYESFHPGFGPSDSYMGRQDSAAGKLTMHGATANTNTGGSSTQLGNRRYPDVSDDDIYEASPKSKEPTYRY